MHRLFFPLVAGLCVSSSASVDSLKADTLAAWIAGGPPRSFILVDVRETSELDAIIGTAACRPYNMPWNSGVLRAQYALLPKTAAVVLYCASGHRSPAAASFLDSLGYQTIYTLVNGLDGWTGPTQPSSNLRPLTDLPAYSMTAGSSVALPLPGMRPQLRATLEVTRKVSRTSIVFEASNPCGRVVERFDTRGARIPHW
ncbi:MAG TPA: rhodanese-like domain-containing protein [Chitinivibrionales bacterium]|nr:rhodanese-like domain-containing protein [Chitinivibrionales bacterium]